MDDITLPPEEEQFDEGGNDEGVSLPDMDSDVTPEEEDDGFSLDESPEDEESPEEVEEQHNSGARSEENAEEEDDEEIEEIDLSELFDSVSEGQDMLDSSDDVLDRISE